MKLQKIFIVLGPPGSGKGTQSELLAKKLSAARIVLGDLIREFIKGASPEAVEAKKRYDQGIPQPDEVATMLLKQKLTDIRDSEVAVFDTYPLSMGEARDLTQIIVELGISEYKVIFLNVPKEEVVKRITIRGQARTDDKPEIAAARYDEYDKRNAPIKEFYRSQGTLIEVNGDQAIEKVHEEIMQKLNV